MTRVLVCGSRDWEDFDLLCEVLDEIHHETPIACVIEGDSKGADRMARGWAMRRGITVETYSAAWDYYGRNAGPIRNREMLKVGEPDLVVAFHPDIANSKGTADMIGVATRAKVPVRLVEGRTQEA